MTTTSKTLTPATYWRCVACGEVWNARRLEAASSAYQPRRWPR